MTNPNIDLALRKPQGDATRRLKQASVVGLAATVLVLAGCSAGGSGPTESVKHEQYTFGVPVDLPSFDPYASNAGSGEMSFLSFLAYDSLVTQNRDGKIVSGLAEKWSTDPHTTTFVLRPNITCSDGSALTPAQVADALNFVGDPKNLTPYYMPVPYKASGEDSTRTVTVTTEQPFGLMLDTLSTVPIVCSPGLKDREALATKSIGTGPWVLNASDQTTYTFAPREGYDWGPDGAKLEGGIPEKLVLKEVTNFTTAASQILSGDLNGARINGPDVSRLTAAKLPLSTVPYQKAALMFNHRPDRVTSDPAVRRALYQAIDASSVAQVIDGQKAKGLRAGEPLSCPGASVESELPGFDAEGAGKALDAAGWSKGSDGIRQKDGQKLTVTVYFQSDDNVLELVQKYWSEIGVDAQLHRTTSQEAQDIYSKGTGDWDASYGGFVLPLPASMQPYLSGDLPPAGFNYAAVTNQDYDRLAADAGAQVGEAGCETWVKAENAVLKQADFTPIADGKINVFASKDANAEATSLRIPVPTSLTFK
ncbi:ABC transporter substrate-binding protein [Arthrobacter sp. 18067]|uniref:ABC transporter substrate-binding protein n=1 Tax=Arthrobacter sp. 18067 TaxID=2681413 RepID=UPI00135BAE0F|nr:ABC transporter substrate-binding protein [Arthrobacter sp. 18067]